MIKRYSRDFAESDASWSYD